MKIAATLSPFRKWLLKATDRVHARLVGTNSITEGQEELERYIGALTHALGHEFRNPLREIKGLASLLQEALSQGTSEHDHAKRIAEAARHMNEMIIRFVMLDSFRNSPPKLIPMAARPLFIEAKEVFSRLAEAQSIQLDCESAVDTEFLGDHMELMQVLDLLIENAADAIGQDGTITLRALTGKARLDGKKTEAVFIDVEDTGPGIHESIERRLFHPFFSTKSHGIGLGLATAARIVAKHHGLIEFKTKLGHGTTFTVILPACEKS